MAKETIEQRIATLETKLKDLGDGLSAECKGYDERMEQLESSLDFMTSDKPEALQHRLDQIERVLKMPPLRKEGEPVRNGAIVMLNLYHIVRPAIVVSSRILREGFPPRYTLFVLFDGHAAFEKGVTEGDGVDQFKA